MEPVYYVSYDKQDEMEPVYIHQQRCGSAKMANTFATEMRNRGFRTNIWWQIEDCFPIPDVCGKCHDDDIYIDQIFVKIVLVMIVLMSLLYGYSVIS